MSFGADDPVLAPEPVRGPIARAVGILGLAVHLTVGLFLYLTAALVVPVTAHLVLMVLWIAQMLLGFWWYRGRRPALAGLLPVLSLTTWFVFLSLTSVPVGPGA